MSFNYRCLDCGEMLVPGVPHLHDGQVAEYRRMERVKDPNEECVRIELRYADGSIRFAEGKDADKILDWWNGSESMNLVHGARYDGPKLTLIPPEGAQ